MSVRQAHKGAAPRKLDGVRKHALETGRNRLLVTAVVLSMTFAAVVVRLVDLMVTNGGFEPLTAQANPDNGQPTGRANILDRNGLILATSLPTVSLYADPQAILDADDAAEKISTVLPGLNRAETLVKLGSQSRFVWLARNLTPRQHYQINRLGIPGVAFLRGERRVYPHGHLAAHVLGLTDVDGRGVAGIERYFDHTLRAGGEALRLSLDLRVQAILHEELTAAVNEFKAIGATGVVLDVNNGEVVAMVSLPDFDPNAPGQIRGDAGFNRATKGVYEMGSTFKLFTAAMALDSGAVNLDGGYDASKPIRVARFTISDYHAKNRWLSVPEIILHSSNIGAAKMAMDVGTLGQREYLDRFGLLKPASVELPEIGSPLTPPRWREINTMTISYGHGIAVSPLQLVDGIAALVNGGLRRTPSLLFQGRRHVDGERVVSKRTSEQMRGLMRLVVTGGTGRKAEAPGYLIGGKTGTADKLTNGGYVSGAKISSFVGAFPINDPRYVVLALVDEPKGNKRTFNYATGGWVAAPVVGQVVERMAPMVGIAPNPDADFATPPLGTRKTLASSGASAPPKSQTDAPTGRKRLVARAEVPLPVSSDWQSAPGMQTEAEEGLILRTRAALAGVVSANEDQVRMLRAVRTVLERDLVAR